jgi:hypothetical protein
MPTPVSLSAVLEPGDHLTRVEFHRRYEARPDIKKAELVEGVVHVRSRVRSRAHSRPHAQVMLWIGTYYYSSPCRLKRRRMWQSWAIFWW